MFSASPVGVSEGEDRIGLHQALIPWAPGSDHSDEEEWSCRLSIPHRTGSGSGEGNKDSGITLPFAGRG